MAGRANDKMKLNIFQRGVFQVIAYVIVFTVFVGLTGYAVNLFEKWHFVEILGGVKKQGLISIDAFDAIKSLIESMDWTVAFLPVGIGGFCALLGWHSVKWVLNRNWSWPVTLSNAIEFRSAMHKLAVVDSDDWIPFVCKYKLEVYVALSPLLGDEQENVRARHYWRAGNQFLVDKKVFDLNIGRQTLCIDAKDYKRLFDEHSQKITMAHSAKIVELREDIYKLKGTISLQSEDIAKLQNEKMQLVNENNELLQKQQTAPARDGKAEKQMQDRIPFYRVAWATINALLAKAIPGTKYTRPQIQSVFEGELENFSELKPVIKKLLATNKKEENNTPYNLEGWGMDYIRNNLGDFVKRERGAPTKE